MMTTLAALFGALPLALESGTGSELRYPLGITIIGGLLLSQMLTLYTTPVIYLRWSGCALRITRPRSARAAAGGVSRRMNISDPFISPAGRHHAARDRAVAGRRGRLSLPAGREHADRRLPDHQREREPARAPTPRPWRRRSPRRWSAGSAKSRA